MKVLSAFLHHTLNKFELSIFALQVQSATPDPPVFGITMTMKFAPLGCVFAKLKVYMESVALPFQLYLPKRLDHGLPSLMRRYFKTACDVWFVIDYNATGSSVD